MTSRDFAWLLFLSGFAEQLLKHSTKKITNLSDKITRHVTIVMIFALNIFMQIFF